MLYDFLQLDRAAVSPLCTQLYEALRAAICSGQLKAGEKLASIRQASAELTVSRTTVETAYARLCMEGYAESRPQSGYRVRAVLPHPPITHPRPRQKPGYDFSTGSVDLESADLDNWKKLVRAVLADNATVASYGDPQGERFLRENLASYSFRARGVVADPDCIFIGAGVGPLLQLLCPLFPEKMPVIMESPGFFQAEQIFRDYGFPVKVPESIGFRCEAPVLPRLERVIAVELPSLRPKTSSSASAVRRKLLDRWVRQAPERYVLEDDYNGELHYRTRALPAFQGTCPQKTIYLGSFSKLLAPSVRIAYMVLPPALAEKARQRAVALHQAAGKTEQLALAEYIRTGLLEKHLRRLRRVNARKSQLLLTALEEVFGTAASCTLYETYLSVVLTLNTAADGETLCARARQAGILCRTAPGFSEDRPHIALGFSGIPPEKIRPGAMALGAAWRSLLAPD